jgi:hypothetical protein
MPLRYRSHDFTIKEHYDADRQVTRLEVIDPPPIGAYTAFSLELLATAERGISVDAEGRLVVVGMTFRLVGLDPGVLLSGPPQLLVGERVA